MNVGKWLSLVLAVILFEFLGYRRIQASFTPTDNYLIVCGSSQNVTFQGRTFVPDFLHSSISLKTKRSYYVASSNSSVPSSIFRSARIFSSIASYEFDIKQRGRHWVRLYFFPVAVPKSGHNLISAPITVVTDGFVLLNNFTFENCNGSFLFKEFAINVTSATLTLTFVPWNDSVLFVNAIEVALGLNPSTPISGLSEFGMETVYRLNLGGPLISAQNDTLGRTWENDSKYLRVNGSSLNVSIDPASIKYTDSITEETALNWVYATAETMGDANSLYALVFNLYINDDIAAASLELSTLTNNLNVPYYMDFISSSSAGSDTLTVSISPDSVTDITNATLSGLEIMKISNEAGSLDGISSVKNLLLLSSSKKNKIWIIIGSLVGAVIAVAFIGFFCCCLLMWKSKTNHQGYPLHGNSQTMTKMSMASKRSGTASCISSSSLSFGRFFTFQEMLDATNKFHKSLLLGVGGFGRVYRGMLEDGTNCAVKRGNSRSEQGLAEFMTEIEMVSKLRHRHLVSLIGYCDERSEMILVYEYMANGPLRSHLYGTNFSSLTWKQRLEICIGAARGLHYLHTFAARSIIHRDVKTTNILLDENFVAKVSDFGLSKTGPALDQTHVSTAVKGSFGYLDPEYFRRQQLTEKSDVYSFGVVLMEVLCSRPALNPVLPREQVNIAEWAMSWQKKGMLDQIMDSNLVGKLNPASLKKYGETAKKCLAEHGTDRPLMGDVLWNLEYALQLEETSSVLTEPDDNSMNHIPMIRLTPLESFDNSVTMINRGNSGTDCDAEDSLVNPCGR
ncbi:hypothetical protein ES288_A04G035300v1 [Gossypium darwinii]|uniref:Protein kinase domain-containing protein n=1 Tax=Gossypium darwinii TaxID=34276 RepID=A0A5D2GTV8_GOSDA|nr:hypothetical protein ES288_A04G035300v1 [Gossypium darwinii]